MAGRQQQPTLEESAKWLRSYSKVSKWLQQYDIMALLQQQGGLCRIRNFLPPNVAEHAYQMVRRVPEHAWNATGAADDYRQNNIDHFFWSTKQSASVQGLLRAFSILLPDRLHTFSVARYDTTHHIAPHDDRAYTDVVMDNGQVVECSRQVAVIYYLTKDWRPEWGGHLVDLEGGATLVPEFNSVVAFTVPRYHEVTPVTGPHPRYSVFGWFLEPGRLYDLYAGEDEAMDEAVQAVQDGVPVPALRPQLQGPAVGPGQLGHAADRQAQQQQQQQQHWEGFAVLPSGGAAVAPAAAAATGTRHRDARTKRRRQGAAAAEPGSGARNAPGVAVPECAQQPVAHPDRGRRRSAVGGAEQMLCGQGSSLSAMGGVRATRRLGSSANVVAGDVVDGNAGEADIGSGEDRLVLPMARRGMLRLLHRLPYC